MPIGGLMSHLEADRQAAVFSREEVEVSATPEEIWEIMSDIEKWPQWNPDVKAATIEGELVEGTDFRWKAGPGTIHSTLRTVERPRVLAWTGKTMGIPAIHVYKLEPAGSGTRLVLEESWDGLLSKVFRSYMQKTLDKAVRDGVQALKTEAEKRSAA
jgi:carbon monoxide dehydrogenase subunit G